MSTTTALMMSFGTGLYLLVLSLVFFTLILMALYVFWSIK